jgi:superfamily I DNA and/or RNA helicase
VQYRFPEALANFPSSEFYERRLKSAITGEEVGRVLAPLENLAFPWPRVDGRIQPAVFVHCTTEEDYGGMSKSNEGQAQLVKQIIRLLTTLRVPEEGKEPEQLSIAVLSPYTKQRTLLQHTLPGRIQSSTIDAFQGREADIIVFSTVRSNVEREIGFVEDMRRLNVAWTRARLALIVVGDESTMTAASGLWRRAIGSCVKVEVAVPD